METKSQGLESYGGVTSRQEGRVWKKGILWTRGVEMEMQAVDLEKRRREWMWRRERKSMSIGGKRTGEEAIGWDGMGGLDEAGCEWRRRRETKPTRHLSTSKQLVLARRQKSKT